MDDADEAGLLPAVLVLMMNGAMGAMLAIQAAAMGWSIAVPIALGTLVTIGACRALDLARPWSMRLAATVAPLGVPLWVATPVVADVAGNETIVAVSVVMALASAWTRFHLGRLVAGPEWMRPGSVNCATEDEGWIEELPPAASGLGAGRPPMDQRAYRVRGKPRSTLLVPGSGQRAVTTFPRV